ncbi:MAG: hypothetical protein VW709_08135, partial [Rickettsiales bacterium]
EVADAVVVAVEQQHFRVSGLTVDDDVKGAELSVLYEALYPRSQLSLGGGLYHHLCRCRALVGLHRPVWTV